MSRLIKQGATTLVDIESGLDSLRDHNTAGFISPGAGMRWEQPREETIIPLQMSDGAILGYSRGTYDRFTMSDFSIVGFEASYSSAKSFRQELLDALDLARLHELTGAGDPVYWEYGIQDDEDPDIYRIITGGWQETSGSLLSIGVIEGELVIVCTRN